jgi:hypothetical protein
MKGDILWYDRKSIITVLDKDPVHVTKKNHKIHDDVWAAVESILEQVLGIKQVEIDKLNHCFVC